MSTIFDNQNNKKKCQKFTPPFMVDTMLDLAGYSTNLMGKRVLENSFGTGNILKTIVKRYIISCVNENIPLKIISKNLGNDIYGIELDKELFCKCREELDAIVEAFCIPPVEWNLYNENALTWECDLKFDLIIGNPPYINYRCIDVDSREQIKKCFQTCSIGKFDYCYAFIEAGINILNETGKMVQLVPNNIYKNVFANNLRKLLFENISTIFDYPSQKIFKNVLTSTSIFVYDKTYQKDYIRFKNVTNQIELQIPRNSLNGKWIFYTNKIKNLEKDRVLRFGDVFNASVVIATLLNKAFILDETQLAHKKLEKVLIRKTVSPRSIRYKRNEFIIFPYRYIDNKLVRYTPESFEQNYPCVTKHLKDFSDKLGKRKKDKNAHWFEYGRTQALAHLNQEKLLMSTVITNQVDIYELDKETIPYSGIYITAKANSKLTLEYAKTVLKSDQFMEYVQNVGISVNGKSIRITCKDINDFKFTRR